MQTQTDWSDDAYCVVLGLIGKKVTGEDIRMACEKEGIFASPHAWGGFINGLVRNGDLVPTGEYRAMQAEKSHRRETRIYEVMR